MGPAGPFEAHVCESRIWPAPIDAALVGAAMGDRTGESVVKSAYFVPVSTELLNDSFDFRKEVALSWMPEPEQTITRLRLGRASVRTIGPQPKWNTVDLIEKELEWWDRAPEEWQPGWALYEEEGWAL